VILGMGMLATRAPSTATLISEHGLRLLFSRPYKTQNTNCSQQTLDNLRQRLESAISKSSYSEGKKLKVVTKVNPEMLGGLIVEIGERTIDLSVGNKIGKLNKMLQEAV
jgi:hypothetical protein